MYNIVLVTFDNLDDASNAFGDIEKNAAAAGCTILESAVVRTDAQIAMVDTASPDSDADFDDLDGMVSALVNAAADYCGLDEAEAAGEDELVVSVGELFEASGAAVVALVSADRQADVDALLAPYGDAATTWDAHDVRKAIRKARRFEREEEREERREAREEEREARREAREEAREARKEEREERREARED